MVILHIISIVFWERLDVYVQNYKCLHPDAKQKTRCLYCLPCAFYIMMGQLCQKNTEALVRGIHVLWNHASEFHLKSEDLTCITFLSHSLMLCSLFESYQMLSGFSVASAACCELQVSFFISKWSCRSVSSFQGFCRAGHSQHCLQTKFRTDTGNDVKTTRSIISIFKVYLHFCSKVWLLVIG